MNPGGDKSRQQPSVDPNWTFPVAKANGNEENPVDEPTSLLQTAPLAEARLICDKLEAEGIPCVIRRQMAMDGDREDDSLVKVLVHELDLAGAREIAERPIAPDEGVSTEEERLEQAVGSWHCPKCNERTLDPLPLSQAWRTVRTAAMGILAFPFAVMLLLRVLPRGGLQDLVSSIDGKWEAAWGITVLILLTLVFTARRHKRCSKCGWRTDGEVGFEVIRKN